MRSSSADMGAGYAHPSTIGGMPQRLVDRHPDPPPVRIVTAMAPPRRFASVRFAGYDPAEPSQAAARDRLEALAADLARPPRGRLFRRAAPPPRSVYLDGGFGVGKTHLLASLWHAVAAAGGRATYASFAELVAVVGALSLPRAVEALAGVRLVCIDEFELDDPANTRLVANLLGRLVEGGAAVAATSNTLPGQLGEGRFDAERFRREIETLAAAFDVLTIGGEDYRHRGTPAAPAAWDAADLERAAAERPGTVTLDDWEALLPHLAGLHPIRYRALVEGLDAVFLRGGRPVADLPAALRVAYLVDVLYDAQVPVALAGVTADAVFPEEFTRTGYAKVLGRATSRLGALVREARAAVPHRAA